MNRRGAFAQSAMDYYEAGWSPIPIKPDKRAAVEGFHGREGLRADRAQVARWIKTHGNLGIALRLPDSVIGIDVDAYDGRPGAATLSRLEADLGPLPETYVSTSRSDGISGIRFFRIPEAYSSVTWPGNAGPGIDIITASNRYTNVAPTIHPSGREYRWYWDSRSGGLQAFPDIPEIDSLPELPDALASELSQGISRRRNSNIPHGSEDEWFDARGSGDMCEAMAETVTRWVADLSETHDAGGAHDTAKQGSMAVIGDMAAGHTGGAKAIVILRDAFFEAAGDRRGQRGDEIRSEWHRMVVGAIRYMAGDSNITGDLCGGLADIIASSSGPIRSDGRHVTAESIKESLFNQDVAIEARRIRVRNAALRVIEYEAWERPDDSVSLAEMAENPPPPVDYVVDRIAAENAISMWVAQFKAGKTTLMNNLCLSLAGGAPFLGEFEVPSVGNVGYWNLEVDVTFMYKWQSELITNPLARSRIHPLHLAGKPVHLLSGPARDWAVEWLESREITSLIIDPFGKMIIAENDNDEIREWFRQLRSVMERAGLVHVFIPHHSGHAGLDDDSPRARGGSTMLGDADAVFNYRHEGRHGGIPEGSHRYLSGFGRGVDLSEITLDFDRGNGQLYVDTGSRGRLDDAVDIAAENAYSVCGEHITTSELKELMSGQNQTKIKGIRRAVENGWITMDSSEKGNIKYYSKARKISRKLGVKVLVVRTGTHQAVLVVRLARRVITGYRTQYSRVPAYPYHKAVPQGRGLKCRS